MPETPDDLASLAETPDDLASLAEKLKTAAAGAPFFPAGLRDNLTTAAAWIGGATTELARLSAEVEALKASAPRPE